MAASEDKALDIRIFFSENMNLSVFDYIPNVLKICVANSSRLRLLTAHVMYSTFKASSCLYFCSQHNEVNFTNLGDYNVESTGNWIATVRRNTLSFQRQMSER